MIKLIIDKKHKVLGIYLVTTLFCSCAHNVVKNWEKVGLGKAYFEIDKYDPIYCENLPVNADDFDNKINIIGQILLYKLKKSSCECTYRYHSTYDGTLEETKCITAKKLNYFEKKVADKYPIPENKKLYKDPAPNPSDFNTRQEYYEYMLGYEYLCGKPPKIPIWGCKYPTTYLCIMNFLAGLGGIVVAVGSLILGFFAGIALASACKNLPDIIKLLAFLVPFIGIIVGVCTPYLWLAANYCDKRWRCINDSRRAWGKARRAWDKLKGKGGLIKNRKHKTPFFQLCRLISGY